MEHHSYQHIIKHLGCTSEEHCCHHHTTLQTGAPSIALHQLTRRLHFTTTVNSQQHTGHISGPPQQNINCSKQPLLLFLLFLGICRHLCLIHIFICITSGSLILLLLLFLLFGQLQSLLLLDWLWMAVPILQAINVFLCAAAVLAAQILVLNSLHLPSSTHLPCIL